MNAILVIIIIVVSGLVLVGNLYFLVYFQHPDDKNVAWLPKIVVILGMSFSYLSVLLLPLDVGNRETHGGLNMPLLWLLVYVSMLFLVLVLVPFTIFYYENDDVETGQTQVGEALKFTFGTLIVIFSLAAIMYTQIGYADIPVLEMTSGLSQNLNQNTCNNIWMSNGNNSYTYTACASQLGHISIQTSFIVYLIAMLAWLGWFIFCVLAPVGLVSLPMNLIRTYTTRPLKTELDQYARKKIEIREKTGNLLDHAKKLQKELGTGRRTTKQSRKFNAFKAEVVLLEEEMDLVRTAFKERGGNPIKYWAYLFFGILAASTSLMWFLHILLYMLPKPPITPFLNNFFTQADKAFGLIGTAAYGSFSLYLVWCCVQGNIVLGIRFSFFQVHPMKIGGTLMNSLVYNTGITILSAITTTQFCTMAFNEYAKLTSINNMFGAQATNLRFIDQFFLNFPIAFFAMICVSFIYFAIFPTPHPQKKFAAL